MKMIESISARSFLALMLASATISGYGQAVTPIMGTLPAGTLHAVNNGPGDQVEPHVSGNIITYADTSSGTSQVHTYNLATGQDTTVPFAGSGDDLSDVDGSTVVYTHAQGRAQAG